MQNQKLSERGGPQKRYRGKNSAQPHAKILVWGRSGVSSNYFLYPSTRSLELLARMDCGASLYNDSSPCRRTQAPLRSHLAGLVPGARLSIRLVRQNDLALTKYVWMVGCLSFRCDIYSLSKYASFCSESSVVQGHAAATQQFLDSTSPNIMIC